MNFLMTKASYKMRFHVISDKRSQFNERERIRDEILYIVVLLEIIISVTLLNLKKPSSERASEEDFRRESVEKSHKRERDRRVAEGATASHYPSEIPAIFRSRVVETRPKEEGKTGSSISLAKARLE